MADDEDVLMTRAIRSTRTPAQGTRMNESSGGRITSSTPRSTTVVDSDGNVRRRWQPGDPWGTGKYFFGGGGTE